MTATHLKTFDFVGKIEDISDSISMISPEETPFVSMIGNESITQTQHKWFEDVLRAPGQNKQLQGAEFTDSTRNQPTERSNYAQILSETFKFSGTAQVVKLYGRKNAVDRESFKTGVGLRQDLEYSMVGNAQTAVAPLEATEGVFASVQAQIHADVTTDIGAVTAVDITEDNIVATHEKLYNAGSDANTLMIPPRIAKVIAGFASTEGKNRERNLGADGKSITNVITVYESPFGNALKVKKNRWLRARDVLLIDASKWKQLTLRPFSREKLAKTGDSDRWAVVGEFSLKHVNQKATGLITGILFDTDA